MNEFEQLFHFDSKPKPYLIANQYDQSVERMLQNISPGTNQSIEIGDQQYQGETPNSTIRIYNEMEQEDYQEVQYSANKFYGNAGGNTSTKKTTKMIPSYDIGSSVKHLSIDTFKTLGLSPAEINNQRK